MHDLNLLNTVPEGFPNPPNYVVGIQETWTETQEKIQQFKDTVQLKLHLAQLDAKDLQQEIFTSISELENKIKQLLNKIIEEQDEASLQTHNEIEKAKEHWEITKDHTNKVLNAIRQDKAKVKQLLSELNLKSALAKLEQLDFLEKTRSEMRLEVKDLRNKSLQTLKKLNQSIADFIKKET